MRPYLPVIFCSFASSILLLYPFAYIASGAAISVPTNSFLTSNQSSPVPKDLSVTSNLGSSPYHCTDDPVWDFPLWNPSDCQVALLRLALSDSDRHGDHYFEFLGPGATASQGIPTMGTPRRYTSGMFERRSGDMRSN